MGNKILNYVLSAATVATIAGGCTNDLTDKDFEKCKWIEYDNRGSGRIWSSYMFENIPHNTNNWTMYQFKVHERNGENLEGKIMLPNLDGSGKVGKTKK